MPVLVLSAAPRDTVVTAVKAPPSTATSTVKPASSFDWSTHCSRTLLALNWVACTAVGMLGAKFGVVKSMMPDAASPLAPTATTW